MSKTASLNGIGMHPISSGSLPWTEPQYDDPGAEGEISGSVLSQHDQDTRVINSCSGDHSQDNGTGAPITDSSELPWKKKMQTEHSHVQAAGAMPVNNRRTDENMERLVGLFREFLEAASNPSPGTSNKNSNPPPTQRNLPARKRLFGLTKGLLPESGSNNRYDYEQKYPRDRFGEETAENARIWLTYLDEAEAFDRERVEGWKDTVDVLLVFAGLFSGVITTFISQAFTNLQQDNTQVAVSLLFETVQVLRAQFGGLSINNVPNSTITPTSPFTPSTNASLVNGLWFTSLAVTLSAALFAVLAKQWLYYYMASISGTASEKVRARQLRFNGFAQWKVAAIIDLLPILLYLAVGLFLIGIMILLFPLDAHIASTIVVITGITFTLYFVSVILPVWCPECPYTTSLTIYAGILFVFVRESHRWINTIMDQGFRIIRERINFQARRTIQHLCDYVLGLFRDLFMFISKLGGHVRRSLGRHRPRIFSADFPNFTKWREENIKKAVKNATFLDSQAVNWLYTASADRSVHRIIARSVAVNPTIARHFEHDKSLLSDTLEVSETNVLDLRYGLCLDLLSEYSSHPHWRLLRSIPDHVAESELEEGEYQSYLSVSHAGSSPYGFDLLRLPLGRLITDDNSVKLPLAMWCCLLERAMLWDDTIEHILKPEKPYLFKWKFDPTRELVYNAGLVQFNSEELGWWKFKYLFNYFKLGELDLSSEAKSHEKRHLLLIAIYRHLTSNISNAIVRRESLEHLFIGFQLCRSSFYMSRTLKLKNEFTFFKDILCTDSFWSEPMTNSARIHATRCLFFRTKEAPLFPHMDYHELSLIYQWCSRDLNRDLSRELSYYTSSIFTVLLLPQNRHHLSTLLLNDPEAVFNLSTCLENLWGRRYPNGEGEVIYPLLMDLLESVEMPPRLFTVLYDLSVLIKLWKLLLTQFYKRDPKQFFLIVKSKLDREKLDKLVTFINHLERHYSSTPGLSTFDRQFQASLRVFRQIIDPPQELSTPSNAMLCW